MKIDIFNHILPKPYFDKMTSMSADGAYMMTRVSAIPMLYDVDARFEKIDQFGEDYQQVFSLNLPPVEVIAGPEASPELAQIANDGMAEVASKYPDRFPGFVAALPMNNIKEINTYRLVSNSYLVILRSRKKRIFKAHILYASSFINFYYFLHPQNFC